MLGRVLACIGLAILFAVPTASADWLQEGSDAARTGSQGGPGPAWSDLAWEADAGKFLNASKAWFLYPTNLVIHGGRAIFGLGIGLYPQPPVATKQPDHDVLLKVDLASGRLAVFARTAHIVDSLASDGKLLYAVGAGKVTAFGLGDARVAWGPVGMPLPSNPSDLDGKPIYPYLPFCPAPPVVLPSLLVVFCIGSGSERILAGITPDGAVAWTWDPDTGTPWATNQGVNANDPYPAINNLYGQALQDDPGISRLNIDPALSVVGPYAYLVDRGHPLGTGEVRAANMFAVSLATREGGLVRGSGEQAAALAQVQRDTNRRANLPPAPTGDTKHLFAKWGYLVRGDPDNPFSTADSQSDGLDLRGESGYMEGDLGSGFAYQDTELYASTAHTLVHVTPSFRADWTYTLPQGETWMAGGFALAGGTLYGVAQLSSSFSPTQTTLHAIRSIDGTSLWSMPFGSYPHWAVSDGLAIRVDEHGRVLAVGTTKDSMRLQVEPDNLYPPLGDGVSVDLAQTGPGAAGPPTMFRADWGDGKVTEWQADPVLRHVYPDLGPVGARFFARDALNRTVSAPVTFHVGQDPPGQTFLQRAFSAKNQNATFFIVGLAATAIGAFFGFAKVARRRRRLRRELRHLETEFQRTRERNGDCEGMLQDAHRHARDLALMGKLDEGQSSILERRVGELRARLRLGHMEQRLHFLPHGLVLAMQEHLRDGTLNLWERDHIVKILDEDRVLSHTQKDEVRSMIDAWFRRDVERANAA